MDVPEEILGIIKQKIKKEKPEKAFVESISFEDYKYEVPPIERCMQAFQMEHWGKAIPILVDMRDKQDETIKVIREESEKTRRELGEKIDSIGDKVDKVGDKVTCSALI